jgi:hypothetical protein
VGSSSANGLPQSLVTGAAANKAGAQGTLAIAVSGTTADVSAANATAQELLTATSAERSGANGALVLSLLSTAAGVSSEQAVLSGVTQAETANTAATANVYGTLSVAKALNGVVVGGSVFGATTELLLSGAVVDLTSGHAALSFLVGAIALVGTAAASLQASGSVIVNLLNVTGASRSTSAVRGVLSGGFYGWATGAGSSSGVLTLPVVKIVVATTMSAATVTTVQSAGSVASSMSAAEVLVAVS